MVEERKSETMSKWDVFLHCVIEESGGDPRAVDVLWNASSRAVVDSVDIGPAELAQEAVAALCGGASKPDWLKAMGV